jgi:hypothetical protein
MKFLKTVQALMGKHSLHIRGAVLLSNINMSSVLANPKLECTVFVNFYLFVMRHIVKFVKICGSASFFDKLTGMHSLLVHAVCVN